MELEAVAFRPNDLIILNPVSVFSLHQSAVPCQILVASIHLCVNIPSLEHITRDYVFSYFLFKSPLHYLLVLYQNQSIMRRF